MTYVAELTPEVTKLLRNHLLKLAEAGLPCTMDKLAQIAVVDGSERCKSPPHDWVMKRAIERHREEPEWPFYLSEETFTMWKMDIVVSYYITCYLQRLAGDEGIAM